MGSSTQISRSTKARFSSSHILFCLQNALLNKLRVAPKPFLILRKRRLIRINLHNQSRMYIKYQSVLWEVRMNYLYVTEFDLTQLNTNNCILNNIFL